MEKVCFEINFANICKDYNTAYLDRDNKDPDTMKCMQNVRNYVRELLNSILQEFGFKIYNLNSCFETSIDELASNRFLFYSLEKEITLQSFLIDLKCKPYSTLEDWIKCSNSGIVIKNDEDGGLIYLYVIKNSKEYEFLSKIINNKD